jgi:hypothetical protein
MMMMMMMMMMMIIIIIIISQFKREKCRCLPLGKGLKTRRLKEQRALEPAD